MKTLSPKQVARALAVSESSLKRWCDRGLLPFTKTSGGHRRLTVDSVLRFVKESGRSLAYPELLGLPARTGTGQRTLAAAQDDLFSALLAADETRCRQILFDGHLAGIPLSRLFDEVVTPAFERIGEAWACGQVHVFEERRAVETCERVLYELRQALGNGPPAAPLAIGGTPEPDPYSLATAMVELVLRQRGWNAQSLGSRLPLETAQAAVAQLRPRLFWLSVSYLDDEGRFLEEYARFYSRVQSEVVVIVGGKALTSELRRHMQYAAYCDNLQHLEGFVAATWPAVRTRHARKGRTPAAG